jgi:pyrroline-5-carboxylate reductase
MSDYQLGIIGGGNMAGAILRGLIGNWLLAPEAIVVSEPLAARRQQLSRLQIKLTDDNLTAARCPRVLLAVKPQVLPEVLQQIAPVVAPETLVISIAAGCATALIDRLLAGRGRIARVMPNTPMLVGAGMSAIAAGPRATEEDLQWVERMFSVGGQTVRVGESMMDAVTAVSGSGPAYFFYLVEAMTAAGVAEGLDEATAARLARAACAGAGKLLAESVDSAGELRRRVTSPGGTTQAAIEAMESAGLREALVKAVRAAAERSRELGR